MARLLLTNHVLFLGILRLTWHRILTLSDYFLFSDSPRTLIGGCQSSAMIVSFIILYFLLLFSFFLLTSNYFNHNFHFYVLLTKLLTLNSC